MALLKIAQIGEPVLREVARELDASEIASTEIQTFIDDLVETMRDANGAGLAANQVYRRVRICVVETRANNPRYPYNPAIPLTAMVNPVVEPLSNEKFDNLEGCLSVPNLRGLVPRFAQIKLHYLDRNGEPHVEEYQGVSAGTFQHECDHLDGRLFVDVVEDSTSLSTLENFAKYHERRCIEQATEIVRRYGG